MHRGQAARPAANDGGRRETLLLPPANRCEEAETVEAVETAEPAPTRRHWPIACRPMTRRPQLPTRVTPLSAEAEAACRKLLETHAETTLPGTEGESPDDAVSDWIGAPGDHVPDTIRRRGRALTFVVSTSLAPGMNRVAVPTSMFREKDGIAPRILSVRSARGGTTEVTVPDHLRARMFPGARSVVLRFGAE
jgi:hypothetical protein